MPLIEGVGDELVYTALVAVPLVFIFRSSLRYFSLCFTFLSFFSLMVSFLLLLILFLASPSKLRNNLVVVFLLLEMTLQQAKKKKGFE
jgi:hypothetical protein